MACLIRMSAVCPKESGASPHRMNGAADGKNGDGFSLQRRQLFPGGGTNKRVEHPSTVFQMRIREPGFTLSATLTDCYGALARRFPQCPFLNS
ncbi:hypothetical protein T265_12296 [Opisthorchis viverrini]|uniref:Uncharacterized protein n=1 Tax=Opisthorchis viverrini TaxID=6198 RepID=A0A074YUI0_OPIVI|nr:hypothetical protein T265_12296 [Opisthorchis viverrini]KER18363.1 hypothetical protein T265_12296 [Opisthorchis viverrini]